ncbi:hypothetical protein ACTXJ3_16440 [Brachybacterium paraconglomeratum]|uniref:hypothetical protein n=1 Tax=Brachybacterium paraconglomeratum TaxID=173362 RepID=UPI003FD4763F
MLLGREDGAQAVADLEVGDAVDIEIGPDQDVDLGIADSHQILEDGEVPVAWSVTAQWGGTGVQVATGGADDQQVDRRAVVRVDPRTGEMTGLHRGAATVTLKVNGETARMTVKVAGEGR